MLPMKRILVTKFRAMGDTIMMTAALKELHRHYPQAEIHVAAPDPWITLIEGAPGVAKLWPINWHADKAARTKAATALAFKLRKIKFDAVFGFHASPVSAMVALTTGAKLRSLHFHNSKSKNMYSTVKIPGKGTMKPVVERDFDTLRAAGLEIAPNTYPELFLKPEEKALAKEELHSWGLKSPVLGVALGASRATKIWPLHRFAEIALIHVKSTQGSVLVMSGPQEDHLTQEFLKSIPPEQRTAIQIMPKCSVRTLAARISQLTLLVGNDSGPRHLAASLHVPTVTLFGPEHPLEWHPYDQSLHPRLFIDDLACRSNQEAGSPPWCGINECITEAHRCMTGITVDQVHQAIQKLLPYAQSATSRHPA